MKKIITKNIFDEGLPGVLKWKNIKHLSFEDEDEIYLETEDDDFWCIITRQVEETDKEYKERIEKEEREEKVFKKLRYEHYLELKKEFEL